MNVHEKTYEESGFNHYVIANMKALPESTEKMRIISGNNNSPEDAKKLCEFVMKNQKKNRVEVVPLQKVLIELMSNVYHHAYEKLPFMARKWYLYAEHSDDRIKCIFVDTGRGIAVTARKNYLEKVTEKFSDKEDARIIKSVFLTEIFERRQMKLSGETDCFLFGRMFELKSLTPLKLYQVRDAV